MFVVTVATPRLQTFAFLSFGAIARSRLRRRSSLNPYTLPVLRCYWLLLPTAPVLSEFCGFSNAQYPFGGSHALQPYTRYPHDPFAQNSLEVPGG
jgi:hypothetical protein